MMIMTIGVLIHGPEVVDSGYAKIILDTLHAEDDVVAMLGGTMGKVAVMDASLDDVIDISQRMRPSSALEYLFDTCDTVYLLNHGKTTMTGITFGNIVASRITILQKVPFIQIERPGSVDGIMVAWNRAGYEDKGSSKELADILGFEIYCRQPDHNTSRIEHVGNRTIRKIAGAQSDEVIMVDGIVIGRARSHDVAIVFEDGFVVDIRGGKLKIHGAEKLHQYAERIPIDVDNVWIKTGLIRRSSAPPKSRGMHESNSTFVKAMLIDHDAERAVDMRTDCNIAVTVGDDTTAIAGDILYRFSVPIIGIIDGDGDDFFRAHDPFPGSIVLRVNSGYDDIMGQRISAEIFKNEMYIISEAIKTRIFAIIGDRLESVTKY